MNVKIITYEKEFLTERDNSICLFFPEKNENYTYFKNTSINENNVFIFIYFNTFKHRIIMYVENFTITEFMDELDNEVYIYAIGKNIKQIDKKELNAIKRKMIIQKFLNPDDIY